MRLLITGSRTWTDFERIMKALDQAYYRLGTGTVMISGACPSGADAMCEEYWTHLGETVEHHPADWAKYKIENTRRKNPAGFIRNAEMVALGADLCLAFIKDNSKGATMTADLAEKAGISTIRFIEE